MTDHCQVHALNWRYLKKRFSTISVRKDNPISGFSFKRCYNIGESYDNFEYFERNNILYINVSKTIFSVANNPT